MLIHPVLVDDEVGASSLPEMRAPIVAVTYSSTEFDDPRESLPWQLAFRAIVVAGGVPLAIDCSTPQPRIAELIEMSDGLILLGGVDVAPELYGGDPSDPTVAVVDRVRDDNELEALRTANRLRKRTLAICRGFQLLNVSRGGTLAADLKRDVSNIGSHRPGVEHLLRPHHDVEVDPSSQIAKWMSRSGRLAVNSHHHQGVQVVGSRLRVTARAGDGLVEGVETVDGLIVAVQWHPEFLWPTDPNARALLAGFVASCQGIGTSIPTSIQMGR
jgi:putative glutamine amidotransferase